MRQTINNRSLGLTLNKEMVEIPLLQQHKYKCDRGFSSVRKGEMSPIIKVLEETHWLYEIKKK